jgi:hypothetical protein
MYIIDKFVSLVKNFLNNSIMSIQQMQQQLIDKISAVKDEDILRMLGEELSYSMESKDELAGLLNETDLKELIMLANEPIGQNTMSLTEFNSIMEKWSMK